MRILLSDMDQTLLDVVQRFLILKGYEVETANNGTTCIRLLEELQPEILIVDEAIMWSGCCGVWNWISRVDKRCLHSVIIMGDTDSTSNFFNAGISIRHLVKPFGLAELLREVEKDVFDAGHATMASQRNTNVHREAPSC